MRLRAIDKISKSQTEFDDCVSLATILYPECETNEGWRECFRQNDFVRGTHVILLPSRNKKVTTSCSTLHTNDKVWLFYTTELVIMSYYESNIVIRYLCPWSYFERRVGSGEWTF